MFIRAKSRTLKSGKKATCFSLAITYRVDGLSKQRTLLNLGKHFSIPQQQWRPLMQMIQNDLRGDPCLPMEDPVLERTGKELIEKLKAQRFDIHDPRDDRDVIITHEIEHTDSRTVGGERVALKALSLLGFEKILKPLGFSQDQIHWAMGLVVGRMLSPGSELQTHQWMMERSSILDLLNATDPSLRSLYNVGDHLFDHHETIMNELFGKTKELLGFGDTVIFYDLTNTFYMGSEHGPLLKHGRSKEKRHDCLLVTLALVLDGSGFPLKAKIYPGNASEPHTLKQAIDQLDQKDLTVIMDAGIATEENLNYLRNKGLHWLCVERSKTPTVPKQTPHKTFQTTTKTKIRAWTLGVKDQEQRVYLHSETKPYKNDQILDKKRTDFEKAITYLNEGLSVKGRPKKLQVIENKVGRLTEKYSKVAFQYEVKVIEKKESPNAKRIQIRKLSAYDECTDTSGGYVLRTSHTDWDCETIARTYWRLGEIEQTFRSMKSELGLRPIYHRDPSRVEAHLFLSILAFHMAHLIRSKLRIHGIHESWGTLKVSLNHQIRITTVLPQNKTHCILLKQDANLKPFQRKVFKAMGIKLGKNAKKVKAERPQEELPEME
ncbi:MAG: IS1634 family transposase [Bacteroidetes bacterium]|nr:IS1634 family transposase [Bacteroidota bacterium]